jgi:nicotinate-nucleotide adenylyltransferase
MPQPEVTRLGVLGGTFDPIHHGHLALVSEAAAAFALDRVLLVPAGRPWQKSDYADAEDRFLMGILGAAAHPQIAVSRMELDRRGPTYTVDTLSELADLYEGVKLFFITGMDALHGIGTWHGNERFGALSEIIAVPRSGWALPPTDGLHVHQLEMAPVDVSSTDIRERVRTGRPIDDLVPVPVAAYIRDRGLYDAPREAQDA